KSGARCAYTSASISNHLEQQFQAQLPGLSRHGESFSPFISPTASTSLPSTTQALNGDYLNIFDPLAWDFNFGPTISPQDNAIQGQFFRHRSPLIQNLGAQSNMADKESTAYTPSTSEITSTTGGMLMTASGHSTSATDISTASASGKNHDIDIENENRLHLKEGSHNGGLLSIDSSVNLGLQRSYVNNNKEHSGQSFAYVSNAVDTKGSGKLSVLNDLLPSTLVVLEIVNIFFSEYHFLLPCIHQETFVDRIKQGSGSITSDPLLWTVLAVGAAAHHKYEVQALQKPWLSRARTLLDRNVSHSTSPTQALQAAVWMAFLAISFAELNDAWFLTGTACRFANLLRLDRMDSLRVKQLISICPRPRHAIEVEEQRKAIWSLFLLERWLAHLGGFILSLDERNFQVAYPLDDRVFQSTRCSERLRELHSEPRPTDIESLLDSSIIQNPNARPSMNHIYGAFALLGQIMSLHNNIHRASDHECFQTQFSRLENVNALFEFNLSRLRRGTDKDQENVEESRLELWLHALVQICTILLHHPPTALGNPDAGELDKNPPENSNEANYQRCLAAARQFLTIAKGMVGKLDDVFANPFLVTAFFLCGRFISIAWHEGQKQADREDIDFLLMLTDRVGVKWEPLAKKFRKGLLRDLNMSLDEARQSKLGIGCYLSNDCA
ncbi:MAG: hypothetical protein Q9167_005472, partial [Letrouitia subvulpina]